MRMNNENLLLKIFVYLTVLDFSWHVGLRCTRRDVSLCLADSVAPLHGGILDLQPGIKSVA